MGETCSINRKIRNAWKASVGIPEGNRPLSRQRRKWEDIIQVDLK
jgi:hypothetical protein